MTFLASAGKMNLVSQSWRRTSLAMPRSVCVVIGPFIGWKIGAIARPVGSITAVEVRDSPAMRTKSLRMPSRESPSTICWPVRPPTSPLATTG